MRKFVFAAVSTVLALGMIATIPATAHANTSASFMALSK